jgi:hypothetical protein
LTGFKNKCMAANAQTFSVCLSWLIDQSIILIRRARTTPKTLLFQ